MLQLRVSIITAIVTLTSGITQAIPVILGNSSDTDAAHDTWTSNLVINLTDQYTNTSGVQEEITIGDFSFYAHQEGDPVTPFVGISFLSGDFTILAIGTTRTAADYHIGQNTFSFNDGVPKVIYLNHNETIVTGFLDANPDGSGGGSGAVIPYDESGAADQIWYVGGPSGASSASISPYRPVYHTTTPSTGLTRNYHYNIDFDVVPADFIHVSRIEIFTSDTSFHAPGQGEQIDVALRPVEAVNLARVFGTSHPDRIEFTSDNGHYTVLKYVDDTPMEIFGASVENPEMRLSATVMPIPRAPYTYIYVPSPYKFRSWNFDYGDEGVTFHDNEAANPGELEREAVSLRNTFSDFGAFDVTDIESGEWLEYTVDVTADGWYKAEIFYSGIAGGQMHLEIDGQNETGKIILPPTATDQDYSSESVSLPYLTAGEYVLRAYFERGGFHLNSFIINTTTPANQVSIGNSSDQSGILDTWPSNLVINKTDTYTNTTSGQQRVVLEDFSFYAQREAGPVTPFAVIQFLNNTSIVVAIGTTRTSADYQVGQNTFAFSDNGPSVIYLNRGETLATGFLDANSDGSGGGSGSVVPYDENGVLDDLWYLGSSDGTNPASIHMYQELDDPSALALSRNYHYSLSFRASATDRIHVSRIETFSSNLFEMAPGETILFSASLEPKDEDANLLVHFTSDRPSVISWQDFGHFTVMSYEGADPIKLTATSDEDPDMQLFATVVPIERAPYVDINVPTDNTYRFRAWNFDYGDEGTTFHNSVPASAGELERNSVELQLSGSDFGYLDVTNIESGEWLEYTINVTAANWYQVETYYAGAEGKIHFEIDGHNVSGSVTVPATASVSTYEWLHTPISYLTEGAHILRVHFEQGGFLLNSFRINEATSRSAFPGGTPHAIPGTVEAENFDIGAPGTVYFDKTAGNIGGQYRLQSDVDIQVCSEGGYNVAWMDRKEWLEYTVNVAASGTYRAHVRYATTRPQGAIHIDFGGINKTSTMVLPNTGDPQVYSTIMSRNFTLEPGTQVMRIHVEQYGININKIDFFPAPLGCDVPYTTADFSISDETVDWSSGSIDISCVSDVTISLDIEGHNALLMEPNDYLNVYYKVNGGARIAISENRDGFLKKRVGVNDINGNTVELIIRGATSWRNETYFISNIQVTGTDQFGAARDLPISDNPETNSSTSKLIAYPNPITDGVLKVKNCNNNQTMKELMIFDLHGQKVLHKQLMHHNLQEIRVADLKKGVYLLKIDNNFLQKISIN